MDYFKDYGFPVVMLILGLAGGYFTGRWHQRALNYQAVIDPIRDRLLGELEHVNATRPFSVPTTVEMDHLHAVLWPWRFRRLKEVMRRYRRAHDEQWQQDEHTGWDQKRYKDPAPAVDLVQQIVDVLKRK